MSSPTLLLTACSSLSLLSCGDTKSSELPLPVESAAQVRAAAVHERTYLWVTEEPDEFVLWA